MVEIIDMSRSLTTARPATRTELEQAERTILNADIGAVNVKGDNRGVIVIWGGSVCDLTAKLTITGDVRALLFEHGPRRPCDLARLGRGVVLSFSQPVEADQLRLDARRPTITE